MYCQLRQFINPGFVDYFSIAKISRQTAFIALALFSWHCFAWESPSSNFESPSYRITITVNCEEGNVSCDDVGYHAVNKKNHKEIHLRGETIHSACGDGVTPCHFQGYRFVNGDTTYILYGDSDELVISKGDKIIFHEKGQWDWESTK